MVVHLLRVQEGRVAAYRYFEQAFDTLLKSRNFTPYRLTCEVVTKRFAELSTQVRRLQDCFRSQSTATQHNRGVKEGPEDAISSTDESPGQRLAKATARLQAAEKTKLETTAQLHLLRQTLSLHRDRGHLAHSRHDHSRAHSHGPAEASEVSLEDLETAIRLQRQSLAELVEEINDIVDEFRCERVDLAT